MEIGETAEEAAAREVHEEAGAIVEIDRLFATYSIPRIGQVHLVYLANMTSADFHNGQESLDVQLFQADQQSICLLYTSPSPRDQRGSRMPSSA